MQDMTLCGRIAQVKTLISVVKHPALRSQQTRSRIEHVHRLPTQEESTYTSQPLRLINTFTAACTQTASLQTYNGHICTVLSQSFPYGQRGITCRPL